jgi:hypothetical protein
MTTVRDCAATGVAKHMNEFVKPRKNIFGEDVTIRYTRAVKPGAPVSHRFGFEVVVAGDRYVGKGQISAVLNRACNIEVRQAR